MKTAVAAGDPDPEWLSTGETARRLGVSLRSLYRLIDTGGLPAYKFARLIRLKASEVDAYLQDTPALDEQTFGTMSPMEFAAHEIERVRRSMAMSPSLPADQIHRLIDTCDALFKRYRTLEARDARLRAELDALRPVVAELRQRLTALTRDLND